jgi:hypothetical protein
VLEIHIRHRLRRAGVTATEVILQQARPPPPTAAGSGPRVADVRWLVVVFADAQCVASASPCAGRADGGDVPRCRSDIRLAGAP